LEELVNLIRKKCVDSPPYKFQINPIHKLLMTHNLRTLDLTKSKKDNDDISDVLRLAAIRSPVSVSIFLSCQFKIFKLIFWFIINIIAPGNFEAGLLYELPIPKVFEFCS
jgi:hypothetical protein